MAGLHYPTELTAAHWAKQKGVEAQPTGLPEALKKLEKAADAVDLKLLDTGSLKTSDEVEQRIDDLQDELKRSIKACCDQLKNVQTLATKAGNVLKKDKDAPRTAPAAAIKVADLAEDYSGDLVKAFEAEVTSLTKQLPKLIAEEAKEEADEEAQGSFRKIAMPRVLSAMRVVKRNQPGAKAIQFMIVEGNKHAVAYMGVSVSPGHRKRLIEILKERGDTTFKSFRGEAIWEAKAYTFVGETVPTGAGLAKKLKEGLDDLTGIKYRVRLRKPSGEAEEAEGEVDELDDDGQPVQPGAKAKAESEDPGKSSTKPTELDASRAVTARVATLMPRMQALIASGSATAKTVVKLVTDAGLAAKGKGGLAAATALLDEAEALLPKAGAAPATADGKTAAEGKARSDGQAAGAPATSAGFSVAKLAKARLEWISTRDAAVKGLGKLAERIVDDFRGETDQQAQVNEAVKRLRGLAAQLREDLEDQLDAALGENDPAKRTERIRTVKKTLADLVTLVTKEPLMAELDNNEVMPDMSIVAPMKAKLRDIALALG